MTERPPLFEQLGLHDLPEWMEDAACDTHTAEWFFPEHGSRRGSSVARAKEHRAKRICARCPVRRQCLERALSFVDVQGFWDSRRDKHNKPNATGIYGGLTAEERQTKLLRNLPMEIRLDMLETMFLFEAPSFLAPGERVVA